jgi:hypothetical protein
MSITYNKRPQSGPSVHKIFRHLPLQDPPKFTQIWIFGLKTNHLATLAICPKDVFFFFRRFLGSWQIVMEGGGKAPECRRE